MAVTSRNLHQPAPRRVVGIAPWRPRLDLLTPYLRIALMIAVGYAVIALVTGQGQIWLDDLRYGRPRTQHVSGVVGYNETTGEPTHIITMNLNRRVVVIALPGGDASKAQTLQGPYLFGVNEDLTPAVSRLHDVNNDGKNDLVLSVKQEEIIYINTGDSFRLINAEERQQLGQAR